MATTRVTIPKPIYLLFVVQFLTMAASVGLTTMLGKQVFDITGRELDLGLLGLAEFLPTLVLAPLGGTLSDRFDRRYLILVGLLVNALAAVVLAVYASTDPTAVGPIFGLVAMLGAGQGLLFGSMRALPADMSPPGVLSRVMALRSASWQSGVIVGPVAGGFLYVIAVPVPLTVAAVVLAFAAGLTILLPRSTIAKTDDVLGPKAMIVSAYEGAKFIRRTPLLYGAITLDLFAVLLGGAVALLPAIAEERLGVGAVGLGWMRAAVGIGAAVMTLVIAWKPIERRIGVVLLWAVAVFGVATVGLGLTRSYAVAIGLLVLMSAADAISVFIRSTIVPLATPESMRGRVLSVETVFIGASNELGAFQSGVAGAILGVSGAVIFGGVGTLVVVGLWAALFPHLRNADRFSDIVASAGKAASRDASTA